MGASAETATGASAALRWLTFFPLLLSWQEVKMGQLLQRRRSRSLFIGKAVNMGAVALSTFTPLLAVLLLFGSGAGSIAFLLGFLTEGVVLSIAAGKKSPSPQVRVT